MEINYSIFIGFYNPIIKNINLMNKELQRQKLHSTIWKIAEEQRCAIDGWDFKQYILGTLFYRFISEELVSYINDWEVKSGEKNFNYADIDDKVALETKATVVKRKGFFIKPSELFCNVVKKAQYDEKLNETLNDIFSNIESSAKGTDSEEDIKGLFADFNTNNNKLGTTVKQRNERLVKLLKAIAELDFGNFKDSAIDLFGDAYEYLMSMYASRAGKSGGEFYTPQEVSELLARLTIVSKTSVNKVYDPCCGSGSLLLKFAKILGTDNVHQGFFGQEINPTTYNLCRINMFLHNINYEKFDIQNGDTLIEPKHWDEEPFEAIVSNPPYSVDWVGDKNKIMINDERFAPAGVLAPKSKADLAFTMHILHWLAPNGVAAIVEFPGVLYRGRAEQKIRKYLIDNNFIDCVIQLPQDLFFGTTIATCIIVLKKDRTNTKTLFIDASNLFVRRDASNKLEDNHIQTIIKTFTERKDIEFFAKLVDKDEIAKNDYKLSVSKYVIKQNTKEVIDIVQIKQKWENLIVKQQNLRKSLKVIMEKLGD